MYAIAATLQETLSCDSKRVQPWCHLKAAHTHTIRLCRGAGEYSFGWLRDRVTVSERLSQNCYGWLLRLLLLLLLLFVLCLCCVFLLCLSCYFVLGARARSPAREPPFFVL